VREFALTQSGMTLHIGLLAEGDRAEAITRVSTQLDLLWRNMNIQPPALAFTGWQAAQAGVKRRRVRMAQAPEGLQCTF
jgi:hypothetical protein